MILVITVCAPRTLGGVKVAAGINSVRPNKVTARSTSKSIRIMTWTPRVTVAAVIVRDQRFLMVEEYVEGKLVLNQPAGHLESGESLVNAVRREVLEETACNFEAEGLVGIYRWQVPHREQTYLRFCFAGSVGEPLPGRTLDADITAAIWLSATEIRERNDQLRSPLVARCISDFLTGPLTPLDAIREVSSGGVPRW